MASFTSVNTLFEQGKFYAIPDYQREYAWQNEEIADFWIDIKTLLESRDNDKHFFGAIVTSKYSSDESNLLEVLASTYGIENQNIVHIIDGQQRLTTLMILLGCIRKSVWDDTDLSEVEKGIRKNEIDNLMFDPTRVSGGEKAPKLFTKEKSGAVFTKEILEIEPINQPDKRYKAAKNVINAKEYFMEQIRELKSEYVAEGYSADYFYSQLYLAIIGRAQFCVIECMDDMDEFQVFESLNGKGINLTAVDRIKNIYLSHARQYYNGHMATKNWDTIKDELVMIHGDREESWIIHFFVSYFFSIDTVRTGKSKLASRFKGLIQATNNFGDIHRSLVDKARYYGKLRKADVKNSKTKDILLQLSELGQEQIYVPLLAFTDRFNIESDEYRDIAQSLLVFIVRYTVCRKPTNALDGIFKSMLDLKGSGPKGLPTSEELVSFIAAKQPEDNQFRDAFAGYTTKNGSAARYFLSQLELFYKRSEDGDASPTLKGQTLEHIIPQKIKFEEWYGDDQLDDALLASFQEDVIQSIGNMAILSAEDNSSASNKNYDVKREIYKTGNGNMAPLTVPLN